MSPKTIKVTSSTPKNELLEPERYLINNDTMENCQVEMTNNLINSDGFEKLIYIDDPTILE